MFFFNVGGDGGGGGARDPERCHEKGRQPKGHMKWDIALEVVNRVVARFSAGNTRAAPRI